jgi:hypothetical protein
MSRIENLKASDEQTLLSLIDALALGSSTTSYDQTRQSRIRKLLLGNLAAFSQNTLTRLAQRLSNPLASELMAASQTNDPVIHRMIAEKVKEGNLDAAKAFAALRPTDPIALRTAAEGLEHHSSRIAAGEALSTLNSQDEVVLSLMSKHSSAVHNLTRRANVLRGLVSSGSQSPVTIGGILNALNADAIDPGDIASDHEAYKQAISSLQKLRSSDERVILRLLEALAAPAPKSPRSPAQEMVKRRTIFEALQRSYLTLPEDSPSGSLIRALADAKKIPDPEEFSRAIKGMKELALDAKGKCPQLFDSLGGL